MSIDIRLNIRGMHRIMTCTLCDGTGKDYNDEADPCLRCQGQKTVCEEDRSDFGDINWANDNAKLVLHVAGVLDLAGNETYDGQILVRDLPKISANIDRLLAGMVSLPQNPVDTACENENLIRETMTSSRVFIPHIHAEDLAQRLVRLQSLIQRAEQESCTIVYN